MIIDLNLVTNIEMDDVHHWDAPDYCDAYISSCDYNGREATEEELDIINSDSDFVHECVYNYLY